MNMTGHRPPPISSIDIPQQQPPLRQRPHKSKRPSTLRLLIAYIGSFFVTSLWLAQTQELQGNNNIRKKHNGRNKISVTDFLNRQQQPHNTGHSQKRQRPPSSPRDFVDNRLLQFGDAPYQIGLWDGAPIVLEEYKLLFWTIPKVGCTVLKQLFRRIQGYADWAVVNGDLPHRPSTNGLNYLYHYKPQEADRMLTDPTWTRALFVRDPKERLLSAYLNKVVTNHSFYLRRHCCPKQTPVAPSKLDQLLQCDEDAGALRDPTVSFTGFLWDVYGTCNDPHWQPQYKRLQRKFWPYVNFVGHLETAAADTRRLLDQMGGTLWKTYGASGWPGGAIFADPEAVAHATNARKQLADYYTPALERRVEDICRMDYEHALFNLTRKRYSG